MKKNATENFIVSRRDRLAEIGVYLCFALILYLFFKSIFAFVLLPPGIVIYHRYNKKNLRKKYKETLNSQFKDALLSISAALRAGYSMENALKESAEEMRGMYGEASPIFRELKAMINQLSLGIPLEAVFSDFSKRTGVEDIETFSSVFSTGVYYIDIGRHVHGKVSLVLFQGRFSHPSFQRADRSGQDRSDFPYYAEIKFSQL